MNREQINVKLKEKGISSAIVAEAGDVSPSSVASVISRKTVSKRIANMVAIVLEMSVEEVFPDVEQYHKNYTRVGTRAKKVAEIRASFLQMAS